LARARAALTTILQAHPGDRILTIGHGETVTAAHHLFLDIEPGQMLPLAFTADQASITTWRQQPISWLRPDDGLRWALHRHNDVAHLIAPPWAPGKVDAGDEHGLSPFGVRGRAVR
ncbi:MAG: hypothetical protein HKP61_18885, partial [Dactylosporangium sp.]|nr:histidine phosphatase family protein [Dactylosporangium sp.]NNJ62955.1 hypothetical protein [Dactylosporangium sp.]